MCAEGCSFIGAISCSAVLLKPCYFYLSWIHGLLYHNVLFTKLYFVSHCQTKCKRERSIGFNAWMSWILYRNLHSCEIVLKYRFLRFCEALAFWRALWVIAACYSCTQKTTMPLARLANFRRNFGNVSAMTVFSVSTICLKEKRFIFV